MVKLVVRRQRKEFTYFSQDLGGIPLEMMLIPSGKFIMGAPEAEEGSRESERPQHEVSIPLFFMGRYPITQAQWRAIARLEPIARELNPEPSRFKGDMRPVESVSWREAIEFCARLSKQTGRNYRLPSEAEWEYACRGGTSTPFHFGETLSTEIANYNGEYVYGRGEKGIYRKETTDVDLFHIANDFGLREMHGNVWEWCLDPWHGNYEGAPKDGGVWDESSNDNCYQDVLTYVDVLIQDGRSHIIRGGSWGDSPMRCRSAVRYDMINFDLDLNAGFRVVCVPQGS